MKNLKFRAWDKQKKKYTDDFVLAPTSPMWGAFPIEHSEKLKEYMKMIHDKIGVIDEEWKMELLGFISSDYTLTDWSNYYGLFNYEVEQFTGLCDKNGKEIYEGDLLLYAGSKFTVTFSYGAFKGRGRCYDINFEYYDEFEVIGNIHEKPELINANNIEE